jgi:hypothetical protein
MDVHRTTVVALEALFQFPFLFLLAVALATADTALFIATTMEELMDMEREFMAGDMFTGVVIDLSKNIKIVKCLLFTS